MFSGVCSVFVTRRILSCLNRASLLLSSGLQSVVLYSLPELDGAIDTIPLGGLVGDNIFLIPERVTKMAGRIKKWVSLR